MPRRVSPGLGPVSVGCRLGFVLLWRGWLHPGQWRCWHQISPWKPPVHEGSVSRLAVRPDLEEKHYEDSDFNCLFPCPDVKGQCFYTLLHESTHTITLLNHEWSSNDRLSHCSCLLDRWSDHCHTWTDLTTSQNLEQQRKVRNKRTCIQKRVWRWFTIPFI